ncbi:MAG: CvpA family protein [Magnetococcales bacterium]|nr:CvpA family protein [Magnetococcales bacterium]
MTAFDYVLLTIVGFSALVGVMRGFVKEAFRLAGWIVAYLSAFWFGHRLEPFLIPHLDATSAGFAAFALIFIVIWLIAWGLGLLVQSMIEAVGLTLLDRFSGAGFGIARGVLIILAGFMIFLSFDMEQPKMVKRSLLAPYCVEGVAWLGRMQPMESAWVERLRSGKNLLAKNPG